MGQNADLSHENLPVSAHVILERHITAPTRHNGVRHRGKQTKGERRNGRQAKCRYADNEVEALLELAAKHPLLSRDQERPYGIAIKNSRNAIKEILSSVPNIISLSAQTLGSLTDNAREQLSNESQRKQRAKIRSRIKELQGYTDELEAISAEVRSYMREASSCKAALKRAEHPVLIAQSKRVIQIFDSTYSEQMSFWQEAEKSYVDTISTALSDREPKLLAELESSAGLNIETMQGDLQDISRLRGESDVAVEHLVKGNLRLVIWMAKKFTLSGIPLQDLIQEGNIGLIGAANRFDVDLDIRFSTYATFWVRQALGRACDHDRSIIYIPEKMRECQAQVLRYLERCRELQLPNPLPEEISEVLNIPIDHVKRALAIKPDPVSLDWDGDSSSPGGNGDIRDNNEERREYGALMDSWREDR